jgi:hypothetical protein
VDEVLLRVFQSSDDRLLSLDELEETMEQAYRAPLTYNDVLGVRGLY